jgi:EAL domain-containing protein (putative c-di-GMP-specific phosphodiesterase class I)
LALLRNLSIFDVGGIYANHKYFDSGVVLGRNFQLLFQPIVDARTHCVVACALVSPRPRFTPEGLDLPSEMDIRVWIEALTWLQDYRQRDYKLSMLAHVSEQQLHSSDFMGQLLRGLEHLKLPASCIELEISERDAVGRDGYMIERLTTLRQAGFSIVIDNLGSDYSAISHLLYKPSTGIRIDEALTRRAQTNVSTALIEAILKIASVRDLHTIAAGVQDADTAAILTLLGVHRLQGNYFGLPLDCESFAEGLRGDSHAH